MKHFTWMGVLILSLMNLFSCSTPKNTSASTDLSGEWIIESVIGADVKNALEKPFLGFNMKEKRLYGSTGCNNLMGAIQCDPANEKIKFSSVGCTRRMCHDVTVENAVMSSIDKVCQFSSSSKNQIKLLDAQGNALMVLKKK